MSLIQTDMPATCPPAGSRHSGPDSGSWKRTHSYAGRLASLLHNVLCLPSAVLQGYFDDQDENLTPLAQDVSQLPEEKLAFALGDGRVGLLAVKGRKVRALYRPKTLLPAGTSALEHAQSSNGAARQASQVEAPQQKLRSWPPLKEHKEGHGQAELAAAGCWHASCWLPLKHSTTSAVWAVSGLFTGAAGPG